MSRPFQRFPEDLVPHVSPSAGWDGWQEGGIRVELTDKYIRAIEPPENGRFEFSDTKRQCPGWWCRRPRAEPPA